MIYDSNITYDKFELKTYDGEKKSKMLLKVARMCTKKDQAAKTCRMNSGNKCNFFNSQENIDAVPNNML